MAITLASISSNKRTPTTHYEFDASKAVASQENPKRALIMGIKLSTGLTAELIPKQIFGDTDGDYHWGAGSQIAEMVRAFRKLNPTIELWGVGIDELSAGTAGTITITAGATSTAAGVVYLEIDGRHVECSIPSGTAAAAAGPLIDAAIKAHAEYSRMQYTSGVSGAVVTLTRRWKGVDTTLPVANYNAQEALPAGLTLAIAAGVAGAGNPDASEIITVLGDDQYDVIANPWTDATNLGLIESEMLSRFGGERQIDGMVCSAGYGSVGTLTTLGNSRNSAHVSIMDAGTSPSAVWIWAAEYAAHIAQHYSTPSTGITGGAFAMNVKAPVRASRRKRDERNTLLYEGIATHVADGSGRVYIDRAITTYQTNAQSVPDVAYLKVETMQQLSNIRKDLVSSTMRDFEGFMKADNDNDIPPGMRVATPKGLTLHRLSRFQYWRSQGWCQGSDDAFLQGYTIETDANDVNRFRDQMAPHLMNQMFGVSGRISFVLQQLFAQAA